MSYIAQINKNTAAKTSSCLKNVCRKLETKNQIIYNSTRGMRQPALQISASSAALFHCTEAKSIIIHSALML